MVHNQSTNSFILVQLLYNIASLQNIFVQQSAKVLCYTDSQVPPTKFCGQRLINTYSDNVVSLRRIPSIVHCIAQAQTQHFMMSQSNLIKQVYQSGFISCETPNHYKNAGQLINQTMIHLHTINYITSTHN